jgi:hypothetical protein
MDQLSRSEMVPVRPKYARHGKLLAQIVVNDLQLGAAGRLQGWAATMVRARTTTTIPNKTAARKTPL